MTKKKKKEMAFALTISAIFIMIPVYILFFLN